MYAHSTCPEPITNELDETMMTIHFNANLRPIVGERVGMLHWLMDPSVSGFIIAYDLSGDSVLITNFDVSLIHVRRTIGLMPLLQPDQRPVESWNQELCRQVIISALGTDVPFDILSYRPWLLSRKVAKSYRAGKVFL